MNRREFIVKTAGCAALAALDIALPGLTVIKAGAGDLPDIVLAKGGPEKATRAAVNALGGMRRFVSQGQRVVIKPNMSFPNPPEMATTTHPRVIRELVRQCVEAGASSVMVLDNPLRDIEICLERSQLKDACRGLKGSRLGGLKDKGSFKKVQVPGGKDLKSTMVMKQVLKADVLIAAPVAKSHSATGVSLSMKGMMGLIYNRSVFHYAMDLNSAIVDLCTILKPSLTVIDATRILTEGGPGGPGKVITMNRVIASTDMVAADSTAVELGTWYGRKIKASSIEHIRLAHNRGLGSMNISNMSVKEVTG